MSSSAPNASNRLTKISTEGVIPETALQNLTSKKYILESGAKPTRNDDQADGASGDTTVKDEQADIDSDDEDAALEGLTKEELEG